jgi:hypothetical protein
MTPQLQLMLNLGIRPDPWQVEVLEGRHERLLLNCCRQGGKSTVVALLALYEALFQPGSQILLLSRSYRQSRELFHTIRGYFERLQSPMKKTLNAEVLELANGSRIIPLPCKEETIRGYANVALLVIDEAARVYDDLYRAVRPMLAVSGGRMIILSTPYGKRGFFFDCWAHGGDDWKRIEIPASMVARIKPRFLEQERRALGESWFRQEYCCSFEAQEGMVYPGLAGCAHAPPPGGVAAITGRRVGGIDFGFNSPFAAIWGILENNDVPWLTGEHFCRGKPLSYHTGVLPRRVFWYCDPAGANERAELRLADFQVVHAPNAIRPGIAAVTGLIQSNRLHIVPGQCPNLLVEAGLYRYDPRRPDCETPIDEHNHALDALRYLVNGLYAQRRFRRVKVSQSQEVTEGQTATETPPAKPKRDRWLRYDNEELWTRIF